MEGERHRKALIELGCGSGLVSGLGWLSLDAFCSVGG